MKNGKNNNGKNPNKGAIPFSLIAVIILILSSFAIIYIGVVQDHWIQSNNNQYSTSITATEQSEETFIKNLAVNAALTSIKNISYEGQFWVLNTEALNTFLQNLGKNFGNNNAYINGYLVTIPGYPNSVSLRTSPVPYNYNGVNALGMITQERTPVYIRLTGSVPIEIVNVQTGNKMYATVAINEVVPSTISFLLVDSNLIRYDFTPLGISSRIVNIILQAEASSGIAPTPSTVLNALNLSLYLTEAMVYRTSSNQQLNSILEHMSQTQRANLNPVEVYNLLYGTSYALPSTVSNIKIDLSQFNSAFMFNGSMNNLESTSRSYNVETSINLSNLSIGISLYQYSPPFTNVIYKINSPANVYDINIHGYSFTINASESDVSNPASYTTTYNVNMLSRAYMFVNNGMTDVSQAPSIHNPSVFLSQFAGILDPNANVTLQVYNSSGLYAKDLPRGSMIDVSINNMELGMFAPSNAITLSNVPTGKNVFTVSIMYPNGRMEEGMGIINISDSGQYSLKINTTNNLNMQGLWTLEMSYLQNVPRVLWLSKLSKLFASLMGYPYPPSLVDFYFNNSTTQAQLNNTLQSYLTWANGFVQYLNQNELSTSFEIGFNGYSMIEGIIASIDTWTQIVHTMIYVNQQYGVKEALQQITFTLTNIPINYPDASSIDTAMSYMEGFAAPSGLISEFMGMMDTVPAYLSMYNQMQSYVNANYNSLYAKFGGKLPSSISLTLTWIMDYPTYNLTQVAQQIFNNISFWQNATQIITGVLNSIGVPDSAIGMMAWLMAYYEEGQGVSINQFLENILPNNVSYYYNEISLLISNIDTVFSQLGISNTNDLVEFAAVLIGKIAFAENMSWSDYLNNLNSYTSQISTIISQLQGLGVNSIFGLAALAVYKFAFEQNMSWSQYLNSASNFLSLIQSIENQLQGLGVSNLWLGLGMVAIGKFFVDPSGSWSSYLNAVNSTYLPEISQLKSDFSTLGIGSAWGFGLLILAKYTLASNVSWPDFLNNVTSFWMPAIMNLNSAFHQWKINNVAGFAAVILGKFILMPNSDWAGYFSWVSSTGISDINSIMSSLKNLGISNVWGFGALVLGKFIFGNNMSWIDYINQATSYLSQISNIKSQLQNLGINGFAGLAAVVMGKFVFDDNESWGNYLSSISNYLTELNNLKNDFSQIGLNGNLGYIGFAAVIAVKYLFYANDSWGSFLGMINNYQGQIEQGISFIKTIESKIGVGGTLLLGAATVGALYLLKYYMYPNETISQVASGLFSKITNSYTFWSNTIQQFIGIFNNYGNMPEIFRLMFQIRDVINLVDNTAMYFIQGGNGVFSILPVSVWNEIHNFIQTDLSGIISLINIVQEGVSAFTDTLNIVQEWSDFNNWTSPTQVATLLKNTVETLIQDAQFVEDLANFLNLPDVANMMGDVISVLQNEVMGMITQVADVIASVAVVVQMFQQELTIDHGNVAKALFDLFFGFNLNSAMWYFALYGAFSAMASMLSFIGTTFLAGTSLGASFAAIAAVLSTIATVLLIVAIAVLIIWIIFDWNQFMAMLFGDCSDYSPSVTSSAIVNLENSLSTDLHQTLLMDAGINSMSPGEAFASSANAAGEMFALSNVAVFTSDQSIANAYWNSTHWEKDYSFTLYQYAFYAKSTRWSIINFWESVADLVSKNSPSSVSVGKLSKGFQNSVTVSSSGLLSSCSQTYTHYYAGNIYVSVNGTSSKSNATIASSFLSGIMNVNDSIQNQQLALEGNNSPFLMQTTGDIENLLLNVNSTVALNLNVSFAIYAPDGKIIATQHGHGLPHWAKELQVAGADLGNWNKLMLGAKANLSYVQNFGNASGYTENLSMLPIYLDPHLNSVNVQISSNQGGSFYYQYSNQSGIIHGYASGSISIKAANNGNALYVYLSPGTYTVTWNNPSPVYTLTSPTTKVVTLYPFSSALFYNPNSSVYVGVNMSTNFTLTVHDLLTPAQYNNTVYYKHMDYIRVSYFDPINNQNTTLIEYNGTFNASGEYFFPINGAFGPGVQVPLPSSAFTDPFGNTNTPSTYPYFYVTYEFNVSGPKPIWGNQTIYTYSFINNPYNPPTSLNINMSIGFYMGTDSSSPYYGMPWISWS
ncbi:MAG: hypothetical protein ACP5RS_04550 [Thermoplasmata archaeon]